MGLIKKYWKLACVIVGCRAFLALLFTPQTYLTNLCSPTPLTWARAFFATSILFLVWALLTPPLLWLGGRFPLERNRLLRNLGIHVLLSGPVALVHLDPANLQIVAVGDAAKVREPLTKYGAVESFTAEGKPVPSRDN